MGNNDYERCHDDIVNTMKHYGMRPLEHEVDTLRKDGQQIIIAGVRNPFDLGRNGVSPTLALSPKDFVILLVHTPDYIEDVSVANTDLAWQDTPTADKSVYSELPRHLTHTMAIVSSPDWHIILQKYL